MDFLTFLVCISTSKMRSRGRGASETLNVPSASVSFHNWKLVCEIFQGKYYAIWCEVGAIDDVLIVTEKLANTDISNRMTPEGYIATFFS